MLQSKKLESRNINEKCVQYILCYADYTVGMFIIVRCFRLSGRHIVLLTQSVTLFLVLFVHVHCDILFNQTKLSNLTQSHLKLSVQYHMPASETVTCPSPQPRPPAQHLSGETEPPTCHVLARGGSVTTRFILWRRCMVGL